MNDDLDRPVNFSILYISSTDTLGNTVIDQKVPEGWNDRPPLFLFHDQEEDDLLLKGMCRKGIPTPLRCAVWISSVIRACHLHQPKSYSEEYRTLGKVRPLDAAWDTVLAQIFPDESDVRDAIAPSFGNTDHLEYHVGITEKGTKALTHVLCALEHLYGLDFSPLVPPLTALLLRCMSESYAFCAMREMVQNSTFYFPVTQVQNHAWCSAFADILTRLHPQTAASMRQNKTLTPEGLAPIFRHFFLPIVPYDWVIRIFDIYTLEGCKVIFRFGVALLCLFKKDVAREGFRIGSAEQWWWQIREYTYSGMISFKVLCQKAYGYHGNRIRKRLRFPRRHILSRIIKLEEEKAAQNMVFEEVASVPRPLGLVENENVVLGKPSSHRANLALWLSPSLRLTKLDLIYSSDIHGRTLDIFYRHTKGIKQTIMLCQVLDNEAIIGVFASQPWKQSSQVYGDGECFLFRLDPKPQCWKWKPEKENDQESDDESESRERSLLEQFMVGTDHFISMGGNDGGGSGLRLNEDLTKGESSSAKGYNNEPLGMLTNFDVGVVEVYQLVRSMDGKTSQQVVAEQFHQTM